MKQKFDKHFLNFSKLSNKQILKLIEIPEEHIIDVENNDNTYTITFEEDIIHPFS